MTSAVSRRDSRAPRRVPAINKSLATAIEHLRQAIEHLNNAREIGLVAPDADLPDALLNAELAALHAVVTAPARTEHELIEKLAACLAYERDQYCLEPDVTEPFGYVVVALAGFLDGRPQ